MDIISTLPQSITETILCLLPIEEAARTSIISRDWRYKWTTIPKLVFNASTLLGVDFSLWDEIPIPETRKIWSNLFFTIYRVVLLHRGPIHEFTLNLVYTSESDDINGIELILDQIILLLSTHHPLKKLKMDFGVRFYDTPLSFYSLSHLKDLHLSDCKFTLESDHPLNGFASLTSLHLERVSFSSRETFLHLLSSSPSLKTLCLFMEEKAIGDEQLNIMELLECLPAIENLTAWGDVTQSLGTDLIPQRLPISLIHLKYLDIDCFDWSDNLTFLCVVMKCSPNLEKIKLHFGEENSDESAILEKYSDVLLEQLNELEIASFGNLKLHLDLVKFILAKSPNLKKLMVRTWLHKKDFKMLKHLLPTLCASAVEIIVKSYQVDSD